jgi:hypothetical protein
MNRQLTQETYYYINSTLDKLRNEIMYVDHSETRRSLMAQRDVIKRMIDGNIDECRNIPKPIPPEAIEVCEFGPIDWLLRRLK